MPWGIRLPAWLVLFVAWVGAGFLVPIPFMAVRGCFGGGGRGDTDAAMPAWRGVFLVAALVRAYRLLE